MTPEQFAYWLQGCAELNPDMEVPTAAQWKCIKDHLATVFKKVTPPFPVREFGPNIASPAIRPLGDPYWLLGQPPYLGLPLQVTC